MIEGQAMGLYIQVAEGDRVPLPELYPHELRPDLPLPVVCPACLDEALRLSPPRADRGSVWLAACDLCGLELPLLEEQ